MTPPQHPPKKFLRAPPPRRQIMTGSLDYEQFLLWLSTVEREHVRTRAKVGTTRSPNLPIHGGPVSRAFARPSYSTILASAASVSFSFFVFSFLFFLVRCSTFRQARQKTDQHTKSVRTFVRKCLLRRLHFPQAEGKTAHSL